MKFTVESEKILKALTALNRINLKVVNTILSNVKITQLDVNHIRLVASDMNTSIQYDVEATDIEGEGILYNLANLTSIISRVKGDVSFDNGVIKGNKSKYKIPFSNTNEFPELNFDYEQGNEYNLSELKNAISKTLYATAIGTNGVISGVYFNADEVVATDGNRLVINQLKNKEEFILTKDFCLEIIKLFEGETVNICIQNSKVYVYNDDVVLVGLKMVGTFPNYKALLPKGFNYKVKFNRDDLMEALNMLLPVMDTKAMICELNIGKNNMAIKTNSTDSEGATDIDVKSNIDDVFSIGFNAQFLLDMLKNYNNDVEVKLISDRTGTVFTDDKHFSLIMPVTLKK